MCGGSTCKLSVKEFGKFGLPADAFGTALIMAGMVPVDILMKEMNAFYRSSCMEGTLNVRVREG